MKLKLLFLFCMPLLFTGCLGEGPWGTYHYVYRNMTDKVINVVGCIVDDNDNVVKIDSSFSILPAGEYMVSGQAYGNQYFHPFSHVNYIKVSNGKQVIIQSATDETDWLYGLDCYESYSSKRTVWYTYTFTDSDFENGVPVNAVCSLIVKPF